MLLVSNWKAYVFDVKKAKALVAAAKRSTAKSKLRLVIAPSAPFIGLFADGKRTKSKRLTFGAQDVSLSTGGAATGEVTAAELAGLKLTHAIVGHSERRAMGETDEMVLTKVQHALAEGLTPVLCIGERTRDAEAKYLQFLRMQLEAVFAPLSPKDRSRITIAYEPIWAIGKSAADSIQPQDLHEMVLYIRKLLSRFLPGTGAGKVAILYGGSVDPSNISALAKEGNVQGFLVGRASTEVESYVGLLKALR